MIDFITGVRQTTITWNRVRGDPAPSSVRHLLLVLATYADADGTNVWPSVRTLARDTGYSLRTVQRSLTILLGGAIALVSDRQGGRGLTARYRVLVGQKGAAPTLFLRPEPDRWNGKKGAGSTNNSAVVTPDHPMTHQGRVSEEEITSSASFGTHRGGWVGT